MSRHLLAAGGLVAALMLAACAGPEPLDAPRVVGLEPATARGLAAAVLSHLEASVVIDVSAEELEGVGMVAGIRTSDPELGSLSVIVRDQPNPAEVACGADSGYQPVSCVTDPVLREVVRRGAGGGEGPNLIARHAGDARGTLLLEVHGSGSDRALGSSRVFATTRSSASRPLLRST